MVGGLPSSKLWEIEYNDLIFKEVIGKGNFGCVYRGTYLSTEVAIKQIEPTLFEDPDYAKYIEREVKALRYIRHNGVVYFYGACHHSSGFYLVTEFIDGMDLRRYLKTFVSPPPSWTTRITIMLDLAKTCYFLHSKGILHRDLKSKNVLLYLEPSLVSSSYQPSKATTTSSSSSPSISNWNIKSSKLCDLGFVRIGSQYSDGQDSSSSEEDEDKEEGDDEEPLHGECYQHNGNGKMAKNHLRRMSICGTPAFMPPEILLQKRYDWTVDVFSYGIVMAEILTRRRPGKDFWIRSSENGFDISKEELVNAQDHDCPPTLFDLCLKCCQYQPRERPKFSDIVLILENLLSQLQQQQHQQNQHQQPQANSSNNNNNNNNILKESICIFKQSYNRKSIRIRSNSITTMMEQQQEGKLKFLTKHGWKDYIGHDITKSEQIWIIYYSLNQKIEMTIVKIKSSNGKNSLNISYMDNNLIDGVIILNIKPYTDQYPHIDNHVGSTHQGITFTNNVMTTEDKLLWHKNVDFIIKLQSHIRRWIISKRYQQFKQSWQTDNNNNITTPLDINKIREWMTSIDQLIQSEKDYKERLDVIIKNYLVPLQSKFRINKPLLNYKEITSIFSNIETIIEISNNLYSTFQQPSPPSPHHSLPQSPSISQSSSFSSSSSSSSFLYILSNNVKKEFLNYFIKNYETIKSVYGKYTYNFKFAMNILTWCRGNPDFSRFLLQSNIHSSGDEEFDLAALLALPINRIQTYNLHLQTLSRLTPPKHPDHKDIMAAYNLITNLGSFLQNQLEMSLGYSSIMSIEIMLDSGGKKERPSLLSNGRTIIRQGLLEEFNGNSTGSASPMSLSMSSNLMKKKKHQLILMSDLLILAKPIISKVNHTSTNSKSLSSSSSSTSSTQSSPITNTKYYLKEKLRLNLKQDQVNIKLLGDHPCGIIITFGSSKSWKFLAPSDDEAYHWASDFIRTIHSTNDESGSTSTSSEEKSPSFIQRFSSSGSGSSSNNRPRSTSIPNTPDKKLTTSGERDPTGVFKIPDTPPPTYSTQGHGGGSEKKKFSTLVKSKWKRLSVQFKE